MLKLVLGHLRFRTGLMPSMLVCKVKLFLRIALAWHGICKEVDVGILASAVGAGVLASPSYASSPACVSSVMSLG